MTQSVNPFEPSTTSSNSNVAKIARPKGEFAYIVTCLVLTLLWGFITGSNQLLLLLGIAPFEDSTYFQMLLVVSWIALFLLGVPSLIHFYLKRLNFITTIAQIVVLTVMCYTIPFAIWGGVQLYFSSKLDSKASAP